MDFYLWDVFYNFFQPSDPPYPNSGFWDFIRLYVVGGLLWCFVFGCSIAFLNWLWKKYGEPSFEEMYTSIAPLFMLFFLIIFISALRGVYFIEWGSDKIDTNTVRDFINLILSMVGIFVFLLGCYLVILISKINKIQNYVEEQKRKEADESEQL